MSHWAQAAGLHAPVSWTKMRMMIHYAVQFILCQCSVISTNICFTCTIMFTRWRLQSLLQHLGLKEVIVLCTVISVTILKCQKREARICMLVPCGNAQQTLKDYFSQIAKNNQKNISWLTSGSIQPQILFWFYLSRFEDIFLSDFSPHSNPMEVKRNSFVSSF